jgi:hypothetical protein
LKLNKHCCSASGAPLRLVLDRVHTTLPLLAVTPKGLQAVLATLKLMAVWL